jgi:hypothetical protein
MELPSQNWRDLTRVELAAARDAGALVLIPTGAIEQHADHLPGRHGHAPVGCGGPNGGGPG